MSTPFTLTPTSPNQPERLSDVPPAPFPPRPAPSEAPQVTSPMIYVHKSTQWEYKQLLRNLAKEEAPTAAELNTLGKEGWELAAVTTDAPFVYFYFKRLTA